MVISYLSEILLKYFSKFFVKQWTIGIGQGNIYTIIKNKSFNLDFKWLFLKSVDSFQADPFPIISKNGEIEILYEDFNFHEMYGKISLISLDENFNILNQKKILDTKSHLSYPFYFIENNKTFVFPEAANSGKLLCYEFDYDNKSLNFVKEILDIPLLDATILKYGNKYWIFGTMSGKDADKKLYIFFSDHLLGPYTSHLKNPVKNNLNGTRPAGNFIQLDGEIYRPSQNCKHLYGKSIQLNKLRVLDEKNYSEDPFMTISIKKKKEKIYRIHTINIIDNIIVVDGLKLVFSLKSHIKNFLRYKRYSRNLKK